MKSALRIEEIQNDASKQALKEHFPENIPFQHLLHDQKTGEKGIRHLEVHLKLKLSNYYIRDLKY